MAFVQATAQGLDVKASVRVASTANVAIAAPGTSIDGVTLANGDRVLLKDQSTGSQNGIYVFNGSGSAMTRATDADTSAKVTGGLFTFTEEGTANANSGWILTTSGTITLGTTSLTFTQFSHPIQWGGADYSRKRFEQIGQYSVCGGNKQPDIGRRGWNRYFLQLCGAGHHHHPGHHHHGHLDRNRDRRCQWWDRCRLCQQRSHQPGGSGCLSNDLHKLQPGGWGTNRDPQFRPESGECAGFRQQRQSDPG